MPQLFTNNAYSALVGALSAVATSLTVAAGTGNRFPSPTGGDYFILTLADVSGGTESAWEIVKVTARVGDVLTVVRAQEGTVARAWNSGTPVDLRITANTFNDLPVSTVQQTALNLKANAASPTFTGPVTAPQYFNVTQPYGALQVAGVDLLRFGSDNSGQLAGFRNRIINGDMRIAQRGATGSANGVYTIDRWKVNPSGAALTYSQLFGGHFAADRFALVLNGAASNTGAQISQRLEAANSNFLAGKTITVSAWVYQNTGASMASSIQLYYATAGIDNWASGITGPVTANVSIPSGVWTKVSAQFTVNTTATKGLQLSFNSTALLAGKLFAISEVQLEEGSIATPFEQRPIGLELSLCQRYYETGAIYGWGYSPPGISRVARTEYKVTKRAIPTVAVQSVQYGNGSAVAVELSDVTAFGNYMTVPALGPYSLTGTFTSSAEL